MPKNETGKKSTIDLTSKDAEKVFLSTNICLVEIENPSFLVKKGTSNTYSELNIITSSTLDYPPIANWGLSQSETEYLVTASIKRKIFFPTNAYLVYNVVGIGSPLPYLYLENYNSIHDQFNITVRFYGIA